VLLELIAALILLCVVGTSVYAVKTMKQAPKLIESAAFSLIDSVFDYIHTEEGMAEVATVGKVFGAGAMSVLKLPRGSAGMKITGNKTIDGLLTQIIAAKAPKWLEGLNLGGTS
jgi:hypothetical protein